MAQAVIMAGGQGERFWPLTHAKFPKYRIRIDGRRSLLQGTAARLAKVYGAGNVHVVTTADHAPLIRAELPRLRSRNLIIEPSRNNTANAIHLSCALLERRFGRGEAVSFFPADHLIRDERAFARTMRAAIGLAAARPLLVTVGIAPTFPATGYGYIQAGGPVPGHAAARRVERFVEKPDAVRARRYLKDGRYLWNGGIFTWRLGTFLDAMDRHAPQIARRLDPARPRASYRRLPNISIDYALLEKAPNIAVVRARMDWCDMGNWDMFYEKTSRGKNGCLLGAVYARGADGVLVYNEAPGPVVALGLRDLVVVRTARGVLVCPRGRAEEAALFFKKASAP
jgi:mannose-1-phosphate guanylyltransferase